MSDPVNIIDKRWERSSKPEDHNPADALYRALSQIETGELAGVEHIIVCVGRPTPESGMGKRLSYLQAGGYNHLEQVGLLDSIRHMMQE